MTMGFQCKHATRVGHRCHKKCSSSHSSSRRNSAQKLSTGDEHWSKVLQANEVNANLLLTPCCSAHSAGAGVGGASNKHIVQKVCCQKAARRLSRTKSSSVSSSHGSKDGNFFTTLYHRFVQWVNKGEHSATASGTSTPCSGFRSRSSSVTGRGGGCAMGGGAAGAASSEDWSTIDSDRVQRWCSSLSSDNSELGSFYGGVSASSACSSLTMLSTSTATSGCPSPSSPGSPTISSTPVVVTDFHSHLLQVPHGSMNSTLMSMPMPPPSYRMSSSQYRRRSQPRRSSAAAAGRVVVEAMKRRHSNLTSTVSCPPHRDVAGNGSIVGVGGGGGGGGSEGNVAQVMENNVLCATWPPPGTRSNNYPEPAQVLENGEKDEEEEEDSARDDSVFTDHQSHSMMQVEPAVQDMLGECTIPYSDLQFAQCIRGGHSHEIYTGHWHGEVMIHKYSNLDQTEISQFWQEVSKLSKIRHENVTLFMGACIEPPHLAVVTSLRKGSNSLYQELHLDGQKMTLHGRVNIARQVAQGLGYLHHKGIVAKKLNSRNIYLEPKVKLCLLDHGMPEKQRDRAGYGSLPRGNLFYIAPEVMSSLTVDGPLLKAHTPCSTHTDVYAFGTVLYELISGHFPMKGYSPECIIWKVAVGNRQCLKHIKCNSTLKTLMAKCWKQNPSERPQFTDINTQLQFNVALHKRHSSSEPDALNRFG